MCKDHQKRKNCANSEDKPSITIVWKIFWINKQYISSLFPKDHYLIICEGNNYCNDKRNVSKEIISPRFIHIKGYN